MNRDLAHNTLLISYISWVLNSKVHVVYSPNTIKISAKSVFSVFEILTYTLPQTLLSQVTTGLAAQHKGIQSLNCGFSKPPSSKMNLRRVWALC